MKKRHMHRHLSIGTSFQLVSHHAKKCINTTTFRRICEETKKTRKKVFGYFLN